MIRRIIGIITKLSDGSLKAKTQVGKIMETFLRPIRQWKGQRLIYANNDDSVEQRFHRHAPSQGADKARMEGHDVGTTTTIYAFDNAKSTRAVFEIEFDRTDDDEAKATNRGLEANPYLSLVSAQNDIGYVLLTDIIW